MSQIKEMVKWFFDEAIMGKDLSRWELFIHEDYYSILNDIPFFLAETHIFGKSNDLERLKIIKGREAFKQRLRLYNDTIFQNCELSNSKIVEENGTAMAYVKLRTKITDIEYLDSNFIFTFETQLSQENYKLKFITINSTYDLLHQLIKTDILKLIPSEKSKQKSMQAYLEKLRRMGLID